MATQPASPVIVGVKLLHCKTITQVFKGGFFTGCLVTFFLERLGIWPPKRPSMQILQLHTHNTPCNMRVSACWSRQHMVVARTGLHQSSARTKVHDLQVQQAFTPDWFFCMCANRRYRRLTRLLADLQEAKHLSTSHTLHTRLTLKHSYPHVVKLCQVHKRCKCTASRQLAATNVPPLRCMHHYVSQSG